MIKKKYLIFDQIGRLKETDKPRFIKKELKTKGNWIKDINFMNVGFYIITPIILGIFLGILIDSIYKTKPIFTLILLFLGTISGFYNLFKFTKN